MYLMYLNDAIRNNLPNPDIIILLFQYILVLKFSQNLFI